MRRDIREQRTLDIKNLWPKRKQIAAAQGGGFWAPCGRCQEKYHVQLGTDLCWCLNCKDELLRSFEESGEDYVVWAAKLYIKYGEKTDFLID